jgi:dethiobiotin synthetase
MGKSIFITGTGTDVGKTALSLAVLLWARGRGLSCAYYKPVQCGEYPGGDADWIRARFPSSLETHVTYALRAAVSPHLAAEMEGVSIATDRIREDLRALRQRADLLVIEGAGGAAVPLDRRGISLASLAAEAGIPCLVAAAPGLGTLHHTLSTLAYLREVRAEPAGFAFCHVSAQPPAAAQPADLAGDNAVTLQLLSGLPFFGAVPYSPALEKATPLAPLEAEALCAPLRARLDAWSAA